MSQLHRRQGAALMNFARVVPAEDSELMQQATKDPYALEFLTIAGNAHERDVEQAVLPPEAEMLDAVARTPRQPQRPVVTCIALADTRQRPTRACSDEAVSNHRAKSLGEMT
jgi:hypothetical protein